MKVFLYFSVVFNCARNTKRKWEVKVTPQNQYPKIFIYIYIDFENVHHLNNMVHDGLGYILIKK